MPRMDRRELDRHATQEPDRRDGSGGSTERSAVAARDVLSRLITLETVMWIDQGRPSVAAERTERQPPWRPRELYRHTPHLPADYVRQSAGRTGAGLTIPLNQISNWSRASTARAHAMG